jgi:hypothetical protein
MTKLVEYEIKYNAERTAFFAEAYKDMPTIPDDIRRTAEHIVIAYGIWGICDPGYIANTIALEMGRGDGKSNFWGKKSPDTPA